ncbi:unnamed protein product [Schistosoma mattheei]|uniref:Uncharacterized protein n=1 Tax=Schistosoma mattheei TaxID=31246 RepID=A0A3P8IAM9_9TREM|nr:unnamed protein product [Schistosoma mattheei]
MFSISQFRSYYAYQLPVWCEEALDQFTSEDHPLLPVDHIGLQFSKLGHGLCSGVHSWLVPNNLSHTNTGGPVPILPGEFGQFIIMITVMFNSHLWYVNEIPIILYPSNVLVRSRVGRVCSPFRNALVWLYTNSHNQKSPTHCLITAVFFNEIERIKSECPVLKPG